MRTIKTGVLSQVDRVITGARNVRRRRGGQGGDGCDFAAFEAQDWPDGNGSGDARVSAKKLKNDYAIALAGQAGYPSEVLLPGLRFELGLVYAVDRYPWVQLPAGQLGVVVTRDRVFSRPGAEDLLRQQPLTLMSVGLTHADLKVFRIARDANSQVDILGIVSMLKGGPLSSGAIANRLGQFEDIAAIERDGPTSDAEMIERLLSNKNEKHNNYENFLGFLDHGGRIGLQHDPLLYGAYILNPFLVRMEKVPMLVVEQGQVAVVEAYVGLVPSNTSGADCKFGMLVRPEHRGIWQESLRTGKYPINPCCYRAELVPSAILTFD